MEEEILIFELAAGRYALRSAAVREVLRAFSAVRLPQAPPFVEGLLNLRGEIIPLLDIRKRFGLPHKSMALSDHLIIATDGSLAGPVALRVDRVLHLARLPIQSLAASEALLARTDIVAGVAIAPDGLVLIHDLPRFLSPADREALARTLAAERP